MGELKFDSFNVLLMNSVVDKLKRPFNELIDLIKGTKNIYSENKLEKLMNDLQYNRLEIKTEPVAYFSNHVGNDLDRVSYGYGYVDFGKESIIYNKVLKKKIIVWEEVVKNADDIYLQKVLAFLLDWYLSIDENAIFNNYLNFSETIKKNPRFEYTMLVDFWNNPKIGGFRMSILDKWCGFFSVGISDIISSIITKQSYFFKRRAKFLNIILEINGQDIYNCIKNREENNIEYFYSLIPEENSKEIGFCGIFYENADKEKFADYRIKKLNLELCIYKYISYLYYVGIMDKYNYDETERILMEILKLSNTFYNPDVKVDFR